MVALFIIVIIHYHREGELLRGLQDVAFLPPRYCLPPHFLKIVVEVKASGQPHVMKVWLGVSKGMLHVEYFCSL